MLGVPGFRTFERFPELRLPVAQMYPFAQPDKRPDEAREDWGDTVEDDPEYEPEPDQPKQYSEHLKTIGKV